MKGYTGKILCVDLSREKIENEGLDEAVAKSFIGGRGLGGVMLYRDLQPRVSPLSKENEIIIGIGPLVGTPLIAANRTSFVTKSAHRTFSFSHAGGSFGAEIKSAGYDQIAIKGKAESPVYLWIDGDKAEIRKANHLWGKTTWETDEIIKEELDDKNIKIASIGPAGENLIPYASLIVEKFHASAKGGIGYVAGTKNLKAIAVRKKSNGQIQVADLGRVEEIVRNIHKNLSESHAAQVWKKFGTLGLVPVHYHRGNLAGINYKHNNYTPAKERLNPRIYVERFRIKKAGCFRCPIACHGVYEVKKGPFAGTHGAKLEWGGLDALGPLIGVLDYGAICYFQTLISQYGIDAKEVGSTLGMAMECYEKGIISEGDTDRLDLSFGNVETVAEMIKRIVYRRGFGDILAEGTQRAAELIGRGALEFAMAAKGSGMAGIDVRTDQSWALGHAVSTRGPDCQHHFSVIARKGDMELAERLFGTPKAGDPKDPEAKGRVIWWSENYKAVIDSLGLCSFIVCFLVEPNPMPMEILAEIYSAATGLRMDGYELMRCGERQVQVGRAFNIREGFSRKDDTLPERFLKELTSDEPARGLRVDLEHPGMLDEYYDYRGCNRQGIPTRSRLEEVGLCEIANDLSKHGKIDEKDEGVLKLCDIIKI